VAEGARLLAADLNALHNGILRPDVSEIARLRRETGRLDAMCARRGGTYCERARRANSRYWRLLRERERDKAEFIIELALQYRAAIVVDVPES
jgi:putative transposase